MAIAPDILVAVLIDHKDSSRKITLANTNPRFPKREIQIDINNQSEPVTIDSTTLGTKRSFFSNGRMEQLL